MCNLKVNIYVLETYFTFILFLWSIHAFNLFRNLLYIVVALWRGIPCTFLTKVHTESRLQNQAGIYRYMYCKHYQQTNIIENRNLLNDTKKGYKYLEFFVSMCGNRAFSLMPGVNPCRVWAIPSHWPFFMYDIVGGCVSMSSKAPITSPCPNFSP